MPPFSTSAPSGASLREICPLDDVSASSQNELGCVQKLVALPTTKPLVVLTAGIGGVDASASCSVSRTGSYRNWYCFRLPTQRGSALPSGRNMPMNTWFRYVPCVLADTGSDADEKTLFDARIWFSALLRPAMIVSELRASWYRPPPISAIQRM